MLLPALLAALLAASPVIPGASVDNAADDRQIFLKLETATTALAENGDVAVKRELRLEQCRRTTTSSVNLAPVSSTQLDGVAIYRLAAQASVLIGSTYKCDKCTKWHHTLASGFAISADGIIATNHHVAANATAEAMGVMTADGRFFPVVEILATDKPHDVAILRVDAHGLTHLPLRDDAPAGSPIRCYSHPASTFGCISEGIITRYFKMNETDRNGSVFMQITADYARGSSGGPIIDSYGNAVGMVASTTPVFTLPPSHAATGKAGNAQPADGPS
jgi:serine protease Do